MPKPADSFFLDLTDSLTCKTKLLPYLFQGHFLATDPEEKAYYIPFLSVSVASAL